MKKILTALLLLVTVFTCGIFLLACGGSPSGGSPSGGSPSGGSPVISSNIANLTMDLSGAKQLGITTYEHVLDQSAAARTAVDLRTSNNQGENDSKKTRNGDDIVLVKIDENGNMDEVELVEEDTATETAKTIDEYELEIYKMSVFGEFTAVSYISSYWRETRPDDECWEHNGNFIYNRAKTDVNDAFDYRNNDVVKSYLIHNTTGKIYATDLITGTNLGFHTGERYLTGSGYITTYDGFIRLCSYCNSKLDDCTHEDKDWYDLSINGSGELELKDLLPNKDYTVKHAVKDIYGWIYVATEGIDEVNAEKKTVYFSGDGYMDGVNNNYKLASNGKVYIGSSNVIPPALYYGYDKVMIDGVATPVTRADNFDTIRGDSGYMINGVYYYNGSLASGEGGYTIGIDCVDKREVRIAYAGLPTYTDPIYGDLTFVDLLYNVENIYSAEYRIWSGQNENTGKWELYYIRFSEYAYNSVTMLDVIECGLLLDSFVPTSSSQYHYAKVTSQGTVIYAIVADENGKPKTVEYKSTNYDSNMITIQPLN